MESIDKNDKKVKLRLHELIQSLNRTVTSSEKSDDFKLFENMAVV